MNTKKGLGIIVGVGLMVSALSATALTIEGTGYLGNWAPPSTGIVDETWALNTLIDCPTGEWALAGVIYTRTAAYQPGTSLPDAIYIAKDDTGPDFYNGIDLTQCLYIVGKYAGGGQSGGAELAWYVGDIAAGDIGLLPTTYNGRGLSHVVIYTSRPSVPDGGTTAMLLGVALSGLALLRRKLS